MGKKRMESGGRRSTPVDKRSAASTSAKRSGSAKKGGTSGGDGRKPFFLLLGLIAVVGIAAIAWMASRPGGGSGATTVDPNMTAEAEGYLLGNPDAPVQVIEFADFECPACGQFATVTGPDVRTRLVETGLISYRFYDFPLAMHPNTWDASNAAACANAQGMFWAYHDALFANQHRWSGYATRRPKGVLQELAEQTGLDADAWEDCFDDRRFQANVEANMREGERRGVSQTPTFIIGDRMIPGAISYDRFKAYVDSAAARAPQAPVMPMGDSAAGTEIRPPR